MDRRQREEKRKGKESVKGRGEEVGNREKRRREQKSCDYIANIDTCNHMQNRVGMASSCITYQCVIVIVL